MENQKKVEKSSKKRNLILYLLEENKSSHFTADEALTLVRKANVDIGIATIYRNLKYLEEQGKLRKTQLTGSQTAYYQFVQQNDKHSHHHLNCVKCGAVIDFEEDLLDAIEKIVRVTKGFEIYDHNLTFYGKCKKCLEEEN
ncbi:MAG: transcriptional repressor [Bacillota bacterium]